MTVPDLTRLEDLAEKATPGPWKVEKEGIWAGEKGYDEVMTPGRVNCMAHCYGGSSTVEITDDDTLFIAEFRNAAPSLLAAARAVERIEAALCALEQGRPHIPPSTDPGRREALVARSMTNRAIRRVRAALDGSNEE